MAASLTIIPIAAIGAGLYMVWAVVLMIVTASGMACVHGSDDVANAIGPVAAIVGVVTTGEVASKSTVPPWVLLIGAVGIVVGLATFGRWT